MWTGKSLLCAIWAKRSAESCLTCVKEGSRLRRAVNPLRLDVCAWLRRRPGKCGVLSALALQPPLHKRRTFRTARSDWFSRIHWVWRVLNPYCCALNATRGHRKLTFILSIWAIWARPVFSMTPYSFVRLTLSLIKPLIVQLRKKSCKRRGFKDIICSLLTVIKQLLIKPYLLCSALCPTLMTNTDFCRGHTKNATELQEQAKAFLHGWCLQDV